MGSRNPTSDIRGGLIYEEAWGLLFCAQWMNQPDLYDLIWFQKVPDEAGSGRFYLDDIVIRTKNDDYELYQVKHRQHPERKEWNWKDLYEAPAESKKTSLLKKWSQSLFKVLAGGSVSTAAFLTNGNPSDDIVKFLHEEKIDVAKLQSELPDIYRHFEDEIGADKVAEFLSLFEFRFGQHNIDKLEGEASAILTKQLRATNDGVNNLILALRKEFAKEHPTSINLEQLLQWCEFDSPRPLNEKFDIPDDFQWFDETTHLGLVNELENQSGGIKVIVGAPGSGKSTYLSKLSEVLKDKEKICIKHHYHLSPQESNPQERLPAKRVVEAIKAQFKSHNEVIGDLSHQNSKEIELREFLKEAASRCHANRESFVVIIDGLDHALRHESATELEEFLRQVCSPQPGLWIILGMQEVAKSHLPQIVLDKAPESEWIRIDGLSDQSVDKLVTQNEIGLKLPDHQLQLSPVLIRIRELTKGNPLHLRYTLRQVREQVQDRTITEHDFQQLLPYDTPIGKYYTSLWAQLSGISKSMLISLRLIDEPITEDQFVDLAGKLVDSVPDISSGYKGIRHLLVSHRRGLGFFHTSMGQFVTEQEEWNQQLPEVKRRIKDWLQQSDYDQLKWSLLPIFEEQLGNPDLLLQINREWLLQAIYDLRPVKPAKKLLNKAAEVAFKKHMYDKTFELTSLGGYFSNALDFQDYLFDRVWDIKLRALKPRAVAVPFSSLSLQQAISLAQLAEKQGEYEFIRDDVAEYINKIHHDYDFRRKGDLSSTPPEASVAVIIFEVLDRAHDVKGLFEYIAQFRDLDWSPDLFEIYAKELVLAGQIDKAKQLLSLDLTPEERVKVIDVYSLHNLHSNEKPFSSEILATAQEVKSSLVCLFKALDRTLTSSDVQLPEYSAFPDKIPEYDSKTRPNRKVLFVDSFVKAIALSIAKDVKTIDDWIKIAPSHWSAQVMCALLAAAKEIGGNLGENREVQLDTISKHLSTIKPLEWPDDRESLEWQMPFHETVSSILDIVIALRAHMGADTVLDFDRLIDSIPQSYLSEYHLLQYLTKHNRLLLSKDSFKAIVDRRLTELTTRMDEFPSRTADYLDLAELALIHKDTEKATEILEIAISNLIAYGSHKDQFLDNVIEAIEACQEAGSDKAVEWVNRIASMAQHIDEFTDGDDVKHFPVDLGTLLAKVSPDLLYRFYSNMAKREELFLAEDIFSVIIASLSYDNPFDIALGSTALDRTSLTKLREIASNNSGATKALAEIEGYFGKIEFKDKYTSSSPTGVTFSGEDIEKTEPSALRTKLDSLEHSWDKPKYLKKWFEYWLQKDESGASKAIVALVDDQGWERAEGEILDILFPQILKQDSEKAFDILCWAQANDGGWSRHGKDHTKAEARWSIVKKEYPDRYIEFFDKSVQRSGLRYDHIPSFYVPFPRAVQYFSMFGDTVACEEIVEQSVKTAQELMGNLQLPPPLWSDVAGVTIIDLLLLRLEWPSSYVRERAASALANLLKQSEARATVLSSLTQWIESQTLESKVVLGILPIIRALADEDVRNVDFQDTISCIQISSPVISELIADIERATSKTYRVQASFVIAPEVPDEYEPSKFFQKYITGFLAPHYLHQAKKYEKAGCKDFVKRWSYTADNIRESLDVSEQLGRVTDFLGGRMDPMLSGMSSQLSEVYRTAFLRTINAFHYDGYLDDASYKMLAFSTMPVELSYWEILPSAMPTWWPQIKAHTPSESNEGRLVPLEFINPIEQLTEGVDGKIVLGLDGAVKFPEGWAESTSSARITMIAFGYDISGANIPPAKDIAEELLYSPMATLRPDKAKMPLRLLQSNEDRIEYPTGQLSIGHLMCQPLVCRNRDMTISLWQSYRNYSWFSICNELGSDLQSHVYHNELRYEKNGIKIAFVRDWLDGLSERSFRDLDVPHGIYVLADRDFVMSYLESRNMRLGFIVKITYRIKKYDYEDAQMFDDFYLYKVSPIIV